MIQINTYSNKCFADAEPSETKKNSEVRFFDNSSFMHLCVYVCVNISVCADLLQKKTLSNMTLVNC